VPPRSTTVVDLDVSVDLIVEVSSTAPWT
jgi:hypothetical protein